MKKKILSLLLVVLFIPAVFMFTGCKDDGYKLTNLEQDYKNIVGKCENISLVDNKIDFNYDKYTIGSTKYLTYCVNNIEPYTSIKNYNIILDNLMGFVYENIGVCSNANIEADAGVRNNLKSQLDQLGEAIYEIDVYINQWAEVVEFNYNGSSVEERNKQIVNSQCLSRFKTLLMGYNNLYQKSISFGNSLSSLYYTYALNDANPKIDNVSLADFNSSVIISKLQGRVKYEVSNLSQLFVEMCIDGNDLPTRLTTPIILNEGKDNETITFNSFSLNQTNFKYLDMVNNLNRAFGSSFDAETAVEVANAAGNKQSFYNLAIKAYNLQNILENDNSLFVRACKNVQYSNVESTNAFELQSKEIVDNFKYVVEEYCSVLSGMLDIVIL